MMLYFQLYFNYVCNSQTTHNLPIWLPYFGVWFLKQTVEYKAKGVAENGTNAMLHYYSKAFPDLALKQDIVKRFKDNYMLHMNDSTGPTD